MPEKLTDLSMSTTEEIFEELKRRYEAVVICTYKDRDKTTYETRPWFTGPAPLALGLVQLLEKSIWDWREGTRIGPAEI